MEGLEEGESWYYDEISRTKLMQYRFVLSSEPGFQKDDKMLRGQKQMIPSSAETDHKRQ